MAKKSEIDKMNDIFNKRIDALIEDLRDVSENPITEFDLIPIIEKDTQELQDKIVAKSPVRVHGGGDYKNGWTHSPSPLNNGKSIYINEITNKISNGKKHPVNLPWLLENGHYEPTKTGRIFVAARPHIRAPYKRALKKLTEDIQHQAQSKLNDIVK